MARACDGAAHRIDVDFLTRAHTLPLVVALVALDAPALAMADRTRPALAPGGPPGDHDELSEPRLAQRRGERQHG